MAAGLAATLWLAVAADASRQSKKPAKPDGIVVVDRKAAPADGKVTVDGANVVKTDIMASNGVIHVIDAVVLPK